MNCSPRASFSARAARKIASICAVTCFSCRSARRNGSVTSSKSVITGEPAGIFTSRLRSIMYCTIIIAWFRSSRDWR